MIAASINNTVTPAVAPDAIELLKADHREVEDLFAQFEASDDDAEIITLASAICYALTVHAEIEEQIFYPASRTLLDDDGLDQVDEAVVAHATLKYLMEDLHGMRVDDDLFEARLSVLQKYVRLHVEEQESLYFPNVAVSGLDLRELGARLQALKMTLLNWHRPVTNGNSVSFPALTPGTVSRKTPASLPATD